MAGKRYVKFVVYVRESLGWEERARLEERAEIKCRI